MTVVVPVATHATPVTTAPAASHQVARPLRRSPSHARRPAGRVRRARGWRHRVDDRRRVRPGARFPTTRVAWLMSDTLLGPPAVATGSVADLRAQQHRGAARTLLHPGDGRHRRACRADLVPAAGGGVLLAERGRRSWADAGRVLQRWSRAADGPPGFCVPGHRHHPGVVRPPGAHVRRHAPHCPSRSRTASGGAPARAAAAATGSTCTAGRPPRSTSPGCASTSSPRAPGTSGPEADGATAPHSRR